VQAQKLFPALPKPLRALDLIAVWEMGKEISGSGFDPNVLGAVSDNLVIRRGTSLACL